MSEFKCLLCGCEEYDGYMGRARDSVQHSIVRCDNCDHMQLTPVPSVAELRDYYGAETQRKTALPHMTREQKRRHVEADTMRRIDYVEKLHAKQQFGNDCCLDIGGGNGFFAEALRQAGWIVDEYEIPDWPTVRNYESPRSHGCRRDQPWSCAHRQYACRSNCDIPFVFCRRLLCFAVLSPPLQRL